LADLCEKYEIPTDKAHIIGHEDVNPVERWGWDPNSGFNWDKALDFAKNKYSFPIDLGFTTDIKAETVKKYFNHIEKEKPGGYYPIGGNTVWHGGVHIRPDKDSDVLATLPGKVVAARLPEDANLAHKDYGSRNFILLEHAYKEKKLFSLYMHLKNIPLKADNLIIKKIKWLNKNNVQANLDSLKSGKVVKFDCEVKAGEILWMSGEYGSSSSRAKLLHWEIFSAENLLANPSSTEPQLEGATGWSSQNILVKAVARVGEGPVYVDDSITLVVTKCNFKDATQDKYQAIKWRIESSDHAFVKQFDAQGRKLDFKVPAELSGKSIRAWAFVHSKSDTVSLSLSVESGQKQNWIVAEDNDGNYNVNNQKILSLFPKELFGSEDLLTTQELIDFYKNNSDGSAEKLRFAVCRFTSEWGIPNLDAAVGALKNRGFFSFGLKDKIAPYLWWNEARSAGIDIPESPSTWHYHPVKFLETLSSTAPHEAPSSTTPASLLTGWTLTSQVINKSKAMSKLHIWKVKLKNGINKEKKKAPSARQVTDEEINNVTTWLASYEKHEKWKVLQTGDEPPNPGTQPEEAKTLAGEDAPTDTHEKPTKYEVTAPDGTKFNYEDHVEANTNIFDDGVFSSGTIGGQAKIGSVFHAAGVQAPSPATVEKVFATVSTHEGKLDSINTYDRGYISAGFIQFATLKQGKGSLTAVLSNMKENSSEQFKKYFSDYGIDVNNGTIAGTDPETKAVSNGADALTLIRKDKRLTAIFPYAGLKCDEYHHAQARIAYKRYYLPDMNFSITLKVADPDHPGQTKNVTLEGKYSDVLQSEAGKVACVDRAVQRGENKSLSGKSGSAPDTFQKACQKVVTANGLTNPTVDDLANHEIDIVKVMRNRHDVLGDPSLTQPAEN
jgi:hypothetical protein